jgi:hypothetical protein
MLDTLWPLFARNPRLCRKLPEIAARVIGSYARVHYGAEVDVMAVLHTFNAELRFNSHVHALVTAGGLQTSTASGWRPQIFFVRDKLMRIWQRLVIALLRGALDAGQFDLGIGRDELEDLLQHEKKRGWIVHVQAFYGKEHFLRYAGRYVRRPPIAQWRILAIEDGFVRFWCKSMPTPAAPSAAHMMQVRHRRSHGRPGRTRHSHKSSAARSKASVTAFRCSDVICLSNPPQMSNDGAKERTYCTRSARISFHFGFIPC